VADGTRVCLADVVWEDGADVVASPRQVLRRSSTAWPSAAGSQRGTELEFLVFRDTYEQAWDRAYRDSRRPTSTTSTTPPRARRASSRCMRRIRNAMAGAGMRVEDSKGECNLGQHEINFRYGAGCTTADEHVIYKNGAKEIAAQEGMAIPSWRSSTSARATRATSTLAAPRGRRAVFADDGRRSTASSPASSPACAS
jgi:glutamine synthetase